jgi:hemin uptake protein HemP
LEKLRATRKADAERADSVILDKNRRLHSEFLFSEGDEVFIQHQGEEYRLRRTRNGKLILTK